jgi:hypothetical protein
MKQKQKTSLAKKLSVGFSVLVMILVVVGSGLVGVAEAGDSFTMPSVNRAIQDGVNMGGNRTTSGGSGNVTTPGGSSVTSNPGTSAGGSKFRNPIKASNLNALLVDFLRVITMLGAIVVVIFFILAGFKYVTARGDEKQIGEATKALTWTAVGAAVLLGAQVLARVIQSTVSQLG